MLALTLPARFWRHVEKTTTGCWLWKGGKHDFGHGRFWMNGRTRPAHRVMWESIHGDAGQLFVLHRCDVPQCVNPEHLFLGTHAENVADMVAKHRQHRPIGDLHHNRKLSAALAATIRARLAAGECGAAIARSLNVHRNTVYSVKSGRSWSC